MKNIIISLLVVLSMGALTANADTGESGIPILMLDSYGARTLGLGDTFVGIANDINTISVNPAGLSSLTSFEATTMYMRYSFDMMFGYLAAGSPLGGNLGSIGGSLALFSSGDFDSYDSVGNKESTALFASDFGITVGYANNPLKLLNIDQNLSMGLNIKFVQSKLATDSQTAIGFDIGALYRLSTYSFGSKPVKENLGIGVSLQNIGPAVKYKAEETLLPQNLRIGVGYQGYNDNKHSVLLALDANLPNDSKEIIGVGLEYSFIEMIFARVGYKFSGTEIDGFSAGIGGKYRLLGKLLSLDYALIPLTDFETVHVFSLGVKF